MALRLFFSIACFTVAQLVSGGNSTESSLKTSFSCAILSRGPQKKREIKKSYIFYI